MKCSTVHAIYCFHSIYVQILALADGAVAADTVAVVVAIEVAGVADIVGTEEEAAAATQEAVATVEEADGAVPIERTGPGTTDLIVCASKCSVCHYDCIFPFPVWVHLLLCRFSLIYVITIFMSFVVPISSFDVFSHLCWSKAN